MKRLHHLNVEDYLRIADGRPRPSALALRAHRHVLELCPECRVEWVLLAKEQDAVLELFGELGTLPAERDHAAGELGAPDSRELPAAGTFAAQPFETIERHKREQRRKARRELGILLRTPQEERAGRVRRARSRFRSRALAELLIDESRSRVRTEPREAEDLAGLVPRVLVRFSGEGCPAWAIRLVFRAAAHRANARRVAGDLTAAAEGFRRLRAEMALREVVDPALLAEVASLEASLAIDQRRFGDAEAGLSVALLLAQRAKDRELALKLLLSMANLHGTLGNPDASLRFYDEAEELLVDGDDHYILRSISTGRIVGLCDQGRFAEADALLTARQEVFEGADDAHTGAILSALRGRIALGLGRLDDAAAAFEMARDTLLELGRHYDAALACLDLAETHLQRGDTGALQRLAARLVGLFRAHGVERETLAVLQLLARAVAADHVSASVLADLRGRLKSANSTGKPPGEGRS